MNISCEYYGFNILTIVNTYINLNLLNDWRNIFFFLSTTGMHRFVLVRIIQLFPLLLYIFVQRELWIESCLAERTTSSFEVSLMIMIVM